MEADRLKNMTVNGIPTKVVALGIGSGVNLDELNNIASAPVERNVILVHNFTVLRDVEEQLRNTSCAPSLPSKNSISPICNCKKITFLNELHLKMIKT